MWARGGAEGEREPQADSTLNLELTQGGTHDTKIMTWLEIKSRMLNPLSHRGVSKYVFLILKYPTPIYIKL